MDEGPFAEGASSPTRRAQSLEVKARVMRIVDPGTWLTADAGSRAMIALSWDESLAGNVPDGTAQTNAFDWEIAVGESLTVLRPVAGTRVVD